MLLLTACVALGLAAIHLYIGRLHCLDSVPRSVWLSAAGGVAVAYVFLHVLPDLGVHQETLAEDLGLASQSAETVLFSVGLAGLTVFYGLERLARTSFQQTCGNRTPRTAEVGPFWIHIGAFALYNLLIGYLLLHPAEPGIASTLLFSLAMALHFVTVDVGLRDHHKARYDCVARWILVGAVLAGWLAGSLADLPDTAVSLLFAFLSGGVILNALKEELPEDRQSSFLPFLLGASGYAVLLVAITLV